MDLREFSQFLRNKLLQEASTYNDSLFSVSYKTMEEGKYMAGKRLALVSIADSMNDLLQEFCERN